MAAKTMKNEKKVICFEQDGLNREIKLMLITINLGPSMVTGHGHRLNRSTDVDFDIQHGRLHSFSRKRKKKQKKKKNKKTNKQTPRYSWIL